MWWRVAIALCVTALLAVLPARPQGLDLGIWKTPVAAAGCSQATTFLGRTTGLDATHQNAYTTMICGLVTDTVWSNLDIFYVFATNSTTNALLNLPNSTYSASVGAATITFTADSGYVSDGVNGYIDLGYNPSTATSPNFTQNSAHLMAWSATLPDGGRCIGGVGGNDTSTHLHCNFSGSSYFRVNNSSGINAANGGTPGFFLGNRSAASTDQGYQNNSQIVTGSDTSVAVSNVELSTPSASTLTVAPIRAVAAGGSLTLTQAGNFYSRLNTYITTIHGSVP